MSGLEVAAVVGAVASLLGGAASLAGRGAANNTAELERNAIARQQLADARNNQQYVRALNAIAMRMGQAGTRDAEGNVIRYDPATNQWTSTLSEQGFAKQQASTNAEIQRNTTDRMLALIANRGAISRSLAADRATGPALAAIENFQPMSRADLTGLLTQRAATANADAYRPIVQDTLRQFSRTGTAAAPVLGELASKSAGDLRKAIIDASIAGMTNTDQVNNANQQGLLQRYTTLNANAVPNLQYPGIATDDTNKTILTLLADRAKNAGSSAVGGAYGSNLAESIAQTAGGRYAESVPYRNQLSNLLTGLDTGIERAGKGIGDLIKAFSGGSDNNRVVGDPYTPSIYGVPSPY